MIVNTYESVVGRLNHFKEYIDRSAAIRSGQYIDVIGNSLNTVRELFKMGSITKTAYINTVSEFSKLTETTKAA